MILVTTAGKVGAEAARLLAQQAPVRVLVRDRGKAAALTRSGVDVVEGDLAVPASIDAAMEGVSAVVLVSPAVPAQELDVVRSAASAGVRHVVRSPARPPQTRRYPGDATSTRSRPGSSPRASPTRCSGTTPTCRTS